MTEPTCQPFKPETWPVDADGFSADLCTECGTPVRYGSRHSRCGAALMANGLTETATAATASVAGLRDPHRGGSSYEASMLRNLLARIHGDGGHYVEQHGLEKALADADELVAGWRAAQPVELTYARLLEMAEAQPKMPQWPQRSPPVSLLQRFAAWRKRTRLLTDGRDGAM